MKINFHAKLTLFADFVLLARNLLGEKLCLSLGVGTQLASRLHASGLDTGQGKYWTLFTFGETVSFFLRM
jgi:hypothetical protein